MTKTTSSTTVATKKLFVLDTNVLLHDPICLFQFEEHSIYLPMVTLEELDNIKKGNTEVARNARQVARYLDEILFLSNDRPIQQGIPLKLKSLPLEASGLLFIQSTTDVQLIENTKADNQILSSVLELKGEWSQYDVILVSKDINMRIKARALGIDSEDYTTDKVLADTDILYTGYAALPESFWDTMSAEMESWSEQDRTLYLIPQTHTKNWLTNEFLYQDTTTGSSFLAQVKNRQDSKFLIQTIKDFTHHKNAVWGIVAANREQNFALNLLMDPEIDFVTLLGQAGTGKTLLALAAGLTQTLEQKRFSEIIITRVTIPVGEDIGFLPGTEEEKMTPWMGALEDNLEVLNTPDNEGGDWGRAATRDLIRSRIKIKSLNFMRGRTFQNKYLIIDEAQNLTPKQMKTLITRAGPGTKVICLGNIAQIDTPYLTEGSSGLTYVVDKFKGWPHSGHMTLQRGERSRLADYAAEIL